MRLILKLILFTFGLTFKTILKAEKQRYKGH